MPTTSQWYAQSGGNLIASLWVPRQMGVVLLKDTYVPNIDTHLRYSDVVGQEIAAGGGYTTGGKEILGRATSYDALANEYNLLGSDLTWGPNATFSCRYGAVYEMATADKWLWAILDFATLQNINNGVFQIDWAAGLLSVLAGPPV
jgi:hypothetical protein